MSNRELALEFIRRFCAGEVEGLAQLLAEDFELQGPAGRFRSRAEYLDALEKDPPEEAGFVVTSLSENEDSVAVSWCYRKKCGSFSIAQLFRFRGRAIREIVLEFDTEKTRRPTHDSQKSLPLDEKGGS